MATDSGGSRVTDSALSGSTGTAQVTFAARYSYVQVVNLDTANPLYVTTDGSNPTVGGGGNNQYVVPPGENALIPNDAAMWWQGQGTTNPGTTINIAGATATSTSKFSILGI